MSSLFKRLRSAISAIVDKVSTRELTGKDIDPILDEVLLSLVENDVAYDIAERLVNRIRDQLIGAKTGRGESVRDLVLNAIRNSIWEILNKPSKLDLLEGVRRIREGRETAKIMFVGVNGVGKTTTIAKVGRLLLRNGFKVVVSASDTFRAGAQEQLEIHAKRIGVPIVKHKYGSDPAAVAFDAINYAKTRFYDVVLIDTAGRMHTDIDLMEELRKIKRVVTPHYTILVADALTGNDAVEQARFFEEAVGIDGIILTKVDADEKGGVVLSIIGSICKPILYVGTGQGYDDLEEFNPQWYVDRIVVGIKSGQAQG